MIEISGEVDYIDKGEISSPGISRANKKNIPVLRIRILTSSGKLVQVLHKGDYFGDATIGHEITVKGIEKDGIIHAENIFNKTTNSWVIKNSGCLHCFIASAVYGSPFSSEVIFLRYFRDNFIIDKKYGRKIIETYYRISPFIAIIIVKYPILKLFFNYLFFKPFINVIKANIKTNTNALNDIT